MFAVVGLTKAFEDLIKSSKVALSTSVLSPVKSVFPCPRRIPQRNLRCVRSLMHGVDTNNWFPCPIAPGYVRPNVRSEEREVATRLQDTTTPAGRAMRNTNPKSKYIVLMSCLSKHLSDNPYQDPFGAAMNHDPLVFKTTIF